MSEPGYLDDPHPSTLAPTSLFSTLASRQIRQAQYDDPSTWRTTHTRYENDTPRSPSARSRSSDSYSTTSSEDRALQREWEEQLEQLRLMVQIIVFPFVGKFFGRKFGYFRK